MKINCGKSDILLLGNDIVSINIDNNEITSEKNELLGIVLVSQLSLKMT